MILSPAIVGGAAAWQLAARAQQAEQMPRVGILSSLTSDDPEMKARHQQHNTVSVTAKLKPHL